MGAVGLGADAVKSAAFLHAAGKSSCKVCYVFCCLECCHASVFVD